MTLKEIIAELTGLAGEQAGAAHILETTRFEPELDALTPGAIADARRKAQACAEAIKLLQHPLVTHFPGLRCDGARS
ncbi:hypothetical protein FG93_05507 [Bosea sp. LC85]|uniref:hypothetical protein n=1 Tax=Bosea sp. LC85 TaxID=1502851 RepID=UPI0004E3A0ED|nr:hypothetical protein [Bosea sp. LC85]KFC63997.1 hypothetical protein FG93_05507 [Bosea sp. LC85]